MSDVCLIISTNSDLLRLRCDSIVCVEADGNYSQVRLSGGETRLVTMQLGQMEQLIARQLGAHGSRFIRIGRSLIVNREHIWHINLGQQKLEFCDAMSQRHSVQASREALKDLKDLIEKENEGIKR